MYRITEIHAIESLAAWSDNWNTLLQETPNASFFQSLEWLTAQWQHVGSDRQLRVLLAWDNDQLVGILPLNVRTEKTQLGIARVLTNPLDGWGSFFNPVGRHPERILASCLAHLRRACGGHELIDLQSLPTETLLGAVQNQNSACEPQGGVALIDLAEGWDAYWASRNRDHNRRRNVERCERRLAEQGTITYVRHRPLGAAHSDADPRWDLYDACEVLAQKSWQSGLTNGNTLSHASVREVLRTTHTTAANAGALDLNLLFLNERPIAFAYGYHFRGYVDLIRIGFDPELAKVAPGNALWTRLIQDSFERHDRVLDIGPTCLDYKKFWMTRQEMAYRHVAYSLSPRAQAIRFARWLKSRFAKPIEETNQANKERVAQNRAATPSTELTLTH